MFKIADLIHHAAESPDVTLVVIGLVLEEFGAHVVRRADSLSIRKIE